MGSMNFEITQDEKNILAEVLKSYLDDLHHEIHKTEDQKFKDVLKHKQEILHQLAKKLV